MPDPPPLKRRQRDVPRTDPADPSADLPFAELRCRTNYSFLEGASHPDELVARARELSYQALAVTDRNTLAGVVRAHVAAAECGQRILVGAELTPLDAPPVILLPEDRAGYGRLSRLISLGRMRAPKGECRLSLKDIADHSAGLQACIPLSLETEQRFSSSTRQSSAAVVSSALLSRYRDIFGARTTALASLHLGPEDDALRHQYIRHAATAGVPIAVSNDVHYHVPSRRPLQDVLVAIRNRCSLSELGTRSFPNGERFLKSAQQMLQLARGNREWLERSVDVASRCRFSLSELRYEYPEELVPKGETPDGYLRRLTEAGAARRYPGGVPPKVRDLIEHELRLIADMQYEAYFLTVYDLVRFARERGILCQGRGSAANSVVCFCLGVTSVDPERIDVLFERFVSRERNEAPDIDIDFEHERREEVLQYLFERYGRDRAGMTGVVITYRPRSAVRDVGKALGLSPDRIDRLAGQLEHVDKADAIPERLQEGGIASDSLLGARLNSLMTNILGFPRHLSQHVGGMVMARGLLTELVPTENAGMPGRTVIQWDKDDLDALGLLKVDCLALGMLSCIRKCFELIRKTHGRDLTLATVPSEDPDVYEMMCHADTIGVFQIESRAQMSMLPRLRPRCFYDLVIEVSLVRPGPIQGDMVHPYLRRRNGEEPIDYPDPAVRDVLHKTLGVPIFQEQAMRLAIVAAGFTPGEADQLRRAMGAWRKVGLIEKFREKLVAGMLENGYQPDFAERVFKQISGFGEYGFPESHAASFSLLVYVSAWIKRYHPAIFAAGLINSQPMGFYSPSQLVRDARDHGVVVRPPDVNHSRWDCTLERFDPAREKRPPRPRNSGKYFPPHKDHAVALRLGLRLLAGLPEQDGRQIEEVRDRTGRFRTFEDFAQRTGLARSSLRLLSHADALASLKMNRRDALWKAMPAREELPLFAEQDARAEEDRVPLPEMSPTEEVVADYNAAGLSLRQHPLSFLRQDLQGMRVTPCERLAVLEPERRVHVAGLVLMRQRPSTASGITFMTLEDETGIANLVVYPSVWNHFRRAARHAGVLLARGRLQREGDVIHVVCDRLDDLSEMLHDYKGRSRDFH